MKPEMTLVLPTDILFLTGSKFYKLKEVLQQNLILVEDQLT